MCSAFASNTFAQQNLVPNPSFEEYDSCPTGESSTFHAKHWINPSITSPDYHNICIQPSTGLGVPENTFGFQFPRTGNAYAGVSGDNKDGSIREYIQCQLTTTLIANTKYEVSFFVSIADSCAYACDNIGIYISDYAILSQYYLHFNVNPQIVSPPNEPIVNNIDWTKVLGTYTANGGEKYITLGIFSDVANTNFVPYVGYKYNYPYYYIDDVSVVEMHVLPFRMPTAFTPNNNGANDTFYPVILDSTAIVKEFRIYNAWGALIHNNTEPWDGTYLGNLQPPGVYAYYIVIDCSVRDNMSQTISYPKSGSFTLIR
jgi:gliding motility-associated-like protein